jgi:hypothetical protein
MENQVADFVLKSRKTADTLVNKVSINFTILLKQISQDSFALIWKIMPYVLL